MVQRTKAVITITEPDGTEQRLRIVRPFNDADRLLCDLLGKYAAASRQRLADETTNTDKEAA